MATISERLLRTGGAVAGVALVVGLSAGPASADYPYTGNGDQAPATVSTPDQGQGSGSQAPAYTGAETTIGLLTGLAVVGAGTGLLIAARRRRSD